MTDALEREVSAHAPQLPPSLADRLAGFGWRRNLVGQAGAIIFRLYRDSDADLYLKHGTGEAAGTVAAEMSRLRWLADKLPVPRLVHFECTAENAWLLSQALPGRTAYEWLVDEPERAPAIVGALAEFLRRLHTLPIERCPFNAHHALRLADARQRLDAGLIDSTDFDDARSGWSPEQVWQTMMDLLPLDADPVVSHGDFSLDNILMSADGQVSGVIDLGRVGVADRYQDLAILWNCLDEFSPDLQQTLFFAYGIAEPDERRLNFHLCLDECF